MYVLNAALYSRKKTYSFWKQFCFINKLLTLKVWNFSVVQCFESTLSLASSRRCSLSWRGSDSTSSLGPETKPNISGRLPRYSRCPARIEPGGHTTPGSLTVRCCALHKTWGKWIFKNQHTHTVRLGKSTINVSW